MTLGEVQDRFQECFPFLDIAFYSKPHLPFEATDEKYLVSNAAFIGNIRTKHVNGVVEIKSWDKAADVEQKLKDIFGLNAQIFRYDPLHGWTQTVRTDALSLKQLSQFAADAITANSGVLV